MSTNLSDMDDLLRRNKELEDKVAKLQSQKDAEVNKLQSACEDLEKKFINLKLSVSQVFN
jgi:hypothetical protein